MSNIKGEIFQMEQLIEDLKKRVDHLQYDEISPLKSEVNDMKITLSNNDLLTKQAIESNKKLSDTMDSFKETMIDVAQSVKDSNKVCAQLTVTVEQLNEKIMSVETSTNNSLTKFSDKLDRLDEKSKVDILEWCRSKWLEIILGLGALGYVISQLIK